MTGTIGQEEFVEFKEDFFAVEAAFEVKSSVARPVVATESGLCLVAEDTELQWRVC